MKRTVTTFYTPPPWLTAFKIFKKENVKMYSLSGTTSLTQNEAVVNETEISRCHLTPELPLRLITPQCRLWHAREDELPFPDPFWAFFWPGGQAVARYVLDCPGVVKGARVLDLGCGGGAVGIAALAAAAASVTFNDVDPVALEAVAENLKLNFGEDISMERVTMEQKNLITDPITEDFAWDVVLVGDVLYDSEFAAEVLAWLTQVRCRGIKVFLGDPGRSSFRDVTARLSNGGLQEATRAAPAEMITESLHLIRVGKYALRADTVLENRGFSSAYCWTLR
ncbi:electron transfer flavoprotein beta subunit lysine methyltransferase isoform X2 [Hyalella azteca]|uniref:ETFB lysine methyltransferase n=1 Tax=Hyalella azteca TaxID=294128 RepID=A0A8B7NA10_HYAAZ|nr:electron transfer flavoprotein beta subunit lysine methyltransferase isoform X2 [Hyalella azteca]